MRKRKHTWVLYLGRAVVATGTADSYPEVTEFMIRAAYEDALRQGWEPDILGPDAVAAYRVSVWGPREGCIEHMQPLFRRRQRGR